MELTWWDTQLGASSITSNGCEDIRKEQKQFFLNPLINDAINFYDYIASVADISVCTEQW